MEKRTIVVIGATGNQGSAVTKAFLKLPQWHVRCVTRSISKAQGLSQLGADVVEAELSDEESLVKAFAKADAIFLNTDFWAPYHSSLKGGNTSLEASRAAYDTEVQWGKNAVRAAAKVKTLTRFIYSALGSMNLASGGKYCNGLHWESKAAVVDYIKNEHQELYAKTSLIYVGAYSSNAFLRPQLDMKSGQYIAVLPMSKSTRCPVINAAGPSMGEFVRALVEEEPAGTKLLAYDEYISFEDAFNTWARVTGKGYNCIESTLEEVHAKTGIPLEVLEVPAFLAEYNFMAGVEGAIEPWQLKEQVATTTYEDYLSSLTAGELMPVSDAALSERFTT